MTVLKEGIWEKLIPQHIKGVEIDFSSAYLTQKTILISLIFVVLLISGM